MPDATVKTKKPLWKKLAMVAGGLFGLLLVTAIVLPLVINVDNYRPQIVQTANEQINGKLEMGKLTLSLWGQIKVVVDGFTLSDSAGRKVVAAKDVYFHLPFLSIFSGSPVLTFKMEQPEVNVVKDKNGKMNVLSLMKTKSAAPAEAAKPAADGGGGLKSLPAVVTAARLGVELKDAHLSYTDAKTELVSKVEKLNVQVKDISLSKTMKIAVWADLNTKMGKLLDVKGPFRLTGEIAPQFQGTEFQSATLSLNADADSVAITVLPDLFIKKAGLPTNAQAKLKVTLDSANIENAEANFHNAKLTLKGNASGFSKPEADPAFDMQFQSNDVALAPWADLVPMLKEYKLEGAAFLKGNASGTAAKPQYAVDMGMKNVSATSPMLKAKPEINAVVKIVTDQVKQMSLTMKAPGNNLNVNGSVVSFTKPRFEVAVNSTGMDLDQLINLPKPAPAAKGAAPAPAETAKGGAPAADFDKMLDPLRENEIAAATSGAIRFNLASLKIHEASMTEMNGLATMKDLGFALEKFSMKMFGGTIAATMGAQLKPKAPTYRFSTDVANLNLQKAVESQFAFLKNTLLGKANFKMEGTGVSFNPEPAKRNLNAKGSMKVTEGSFATIDVGRMTTEALNSSIAKTAEKVGALKGKKINPPGNQEAAYEVISSDFTISGGKFVAPNFQAVSKPGKGIDLRGSTTVDITNYALNADWVIADTHNLTHAKDLSVTEGGVTVNNILAEKGGTVNFPVKVTGTCFEPKVNYTAVPEALAKVALDNIARAAGDKVKAEAQKKVEEELKKAAGNNPAIQQAVKGLGKKLFGK